MLLSHHLAYIKDLINDNQVVSIIAPNTIGRCILLPQKLNELGLKSCVVLPNDEIVKIIKGRNNVNNLTYVSSETMRKIFLSLSFLDYDLIMIEDLENESMSVNIIISIWIYAKNKGLKVPKLLICSDKEISLRKELNSIIYKIDFIEQKLNIRYLQQDIEDDELLNLKTAEYAYNIFNNNKYNIAIFAPNIELITAKLKQFDNDLEIISNYDTYREKETKKIFIINDITCIFINTNNIGCVIDTMTEQISSKSFNGGIRNIINLISKQKAKARSVLFNCIYYRMCSYKYYNYLDEIILPEITRIPIHNYIIELLENNFVPEDIIKTKNIEEDKKIIENSLNLNLIKLLPLSLRNSLFLSDWIRNNYPIYPGIVVISLIDCFFPSYFWFPRKNKLKENLDFLFSKRKKDFIDKYGGYNDLETSLNLWMSYFNKNIYSKKEEIEDWTYKNNLNYKKLIEVINLVKQLITIFKTNNFNVKIEDFDISEAINNSKTLLLQHYNDMMCVRISENSYFNLKNKKYYILDIKESINKFTSNYPEKIIAIIVNEIPQERNVLNIIKFAVDISYPEINHIDAQQSVIDALDMLSKI